MRAGRISALLAVIALGLVTTAAGAAPQRARQQVFSFADSRITEASGLVVRGGLFTTVNDSGDSGRVFTVDGRGRTVGVTSWADEPLDDEALAPLPHGRVLVGDIGDNEAARDGTDPPTLRVVPVGRGDRSVTPTTYRLAYPGGAGDAETLLVQPGTGRVLVVTKELGGGSVLRAPRHLSSTHVNRMTAMGRTLPIATDGAFFPDGRHLIVRNYLQAEVYTYPGLRPVASVPLPTEPQGEGIAVEGSRVYVTSEGVHAQVLQVHLPPKLRGMVDPMSLHRACCDISIESTSGPSPSSGGRPWWPWALGGVIGLSALGVLLRSLRPR